MTCVFCEARAATHRQAYMFEGNYVQLPICDECDEKQKEECGEKQSNIERKTLPH